MKWLQQEHEFAFYTSIVTHIAKEQKTDIIELSDLELIHRIGTVLRLEKGDRIILFDSSYHCQAAIVSIQAKKNITLEVLSIKPNEVLNPSITYLLPLLKREAFEEALYSMVELGCQIIQPIVTKKIHKQPFSPKEELRWKKIMIAAAEQSKQFILPLIMPAIPLDLYLPSLQSEDTIKLVFDPSGKPLQEFIRHHRNGQPIILCSGPEGGLMPDEIQQLLQAGFEDYRLTKTILRAQQAVALGLGLCRSLL